VDLLNIEGINSEDFVPWIQTIIVGGLGGGGGGTNIIRIV